MVKFQDDIIEYKEEELFNVGRIVNTHGLKGELRIYPYTEDKENFEEFEYLLIPAAKGKYKRLEIESVRYVKNLVLVKFESFNDINEVERYKEIPVFFPRHEYELAEGEFFIVDLIGLEVYDEEKGRIGVVADVLQNTAQDIYVVKSDEFGEVLIPSVKEFVKSVDIASRRVTVKLIEGMI
jgi:16S rRNA processing protein RimM